MLRLRLAPALSVLIFASTATAQSPQNQSTGERAQEIVTQPARDVGAQRTEIPPLLQDAAADPYDLDGLRTCAQLSAAIVDLNGVLGPDLDAPPAEGGSDAGRVAAAGGRAVVDSIIPFRGLVREISGAAEQQRRLTAAIDAGFARRGFLRGVHRARNCRTAVQ